MTHKPIFGTLLWQLSTAIHSVHISTLITEDKSKAAGSKGFAYKPLAKKEIGELIRKVLDGRQP